MPDARCLAQGTVRLLKKIKQPNKQQQVAQRRPVVKAELFTKLKAH